MDTRTQNVTHLKARILKLVPAGTFAMERFLSFVDISVDEYCPTACVETGPQPRLHVNATFVDEHCECDEHLFVLIMHELRHVMLGHTGLYSRTTVEQNIAFDAIINATLCQEMPEPVYTRFFKALNSTKSVAERLLRPPDRWEKHRGKIVGKITSKDIPKLYGVKRMSRREKSILHRLYFENPGDVCADEIVELLHDQDSMPEEGPVLLGDHESPQDDGQPIEADARLQFGDGDRAAVADPVFGDIVRDMLEHTHAHGKLAGAGLKVADYLLPKAPDARREFLAALRILLQKAGVLNQPRANNPTWKRRTTDTTFATVLPEWRDRHASAREAVFGQPPVLFQSTCQIVRPRMRYHDQAHVYLDISGSMGHELPWLTTALDPLERRGACRLFVFSTVVDTIRHGRLLTSEVQNTWGTSINCVLEHVLSFKEADMPRRVVVLTDGYTGTPETKLAQDIQDKRIGLYVGLIGHSSDYWLRDLARLVEELPSPIRED